MRTWRSVTAEPLGYACREVANTILPNSVIMEEDSPSKHSEGKIPILDMEMWVNMEGYIIYQHYSKPMSSRSVIMARSAFTDREDSLGLCR